MFLSSAWLADSARTVTVCGYYCLVIYIYIYIYIRVCLFICVINFCNIRINLPPEVRNYMVHIILRDKYVIGYSVNIGEGQIRRYGISDMCSSTMTAETPISVTSW
jgi:hypothetical protein